jgi:hypothetical protein
MPYVGTPYDQMQELCTDPVYISGNISAFRTAIKNIREQVVCEKSDYTILTLANSTISLLLEDSATAKKCVTLLQSMSMNVFPASIIW